MYAATVAAIMYDVLQLCRTSHCAYIYLSHKSLHIQCQHFVTTDFTTLICGGFFMHFVLCHSFSIFILLLYLPLNSVCIHPQGSKTSTWVVLSEKMNVLNC